MTSQIAEVRVGAYPIDAPHGGLIDIPVAPRSDDDDAFDPDAAPAAIRAFYERNGYVVLRGLVPSDDCDHLRGTFERQVKPYPGSLYRQTTSGLAEPHTFTAHGHLLNAILNPHDLPSARFAAFRAQVLGVYSLAPVQRAVRSLLGEPGLLVQSMYFEGNPQTWPHQDTYYLDSVELGRMTAGWFALEDIHPGAGRFFVYPGSHRIEAERNAQGLNFATQHDAYKRYVMELIRARGLACRAPALRRGDVLFWAARTIHGSLRATEAQHARSSLTAHFIPATKGFLQLQARAMRLSLETVNGLLVHHPRDQDRVHHRAALAFELRFPRLFRAARAAAIRVLTR